MFSASSDSARKKIMLRFEQKSLEWLMELAFKLRIADELEPDICSST